MSRLIRERIKTVCILILIVAGLLQVGILLGYQNQGTPISFLLGLFKEKAPISGTTAREKLFVPDALVLSDEGKSHWILDKNSVFYNDLWDEAKQGLYKIASGTAGLKASDEKWGDVVAKRGFIIDFGYMMTPELLEWFLGISEKTQELPSVYKVMVKPDIVYKNTSTLYIYSTNGRVYISDPIRYEKKKLEDIILAISENGGQKYRKYYTLRGGKIDKPGDEPDVLYVTGHPRYWPYFQYLVRQPAWAEEKDSLEEIVLGTEKDRYDKSRDNSTVQFNYGRNIYRYYNDGYLTYRYLGSADSDGKGEVGEALLKAYKFVAGIGGISETAADIVLTSVEEKQQGSFSFGFDYKLEGMPVKLELDMKDGSGQKLKHAISIQADSNRVLKCDWLLRDFVQGEKGNYIDRFIDVLAETGVVYKEIQMWDMHSGYFINSAGVSVLKPMLLIDMKDRSTFQVEMPLEKGE